MAKIKIVETGKVPVCPYCEMELSETHVNTRQAPWSLGEKHNTCFCPNCRRFSVSPSL
jgi:hypothetical protein